MVAPFTTLSRTAAWGRAFHSRVPGKIRMGLAWTLFALIIPGLSACGLAEAGKTPPGWQDYAYADGNFTISFPAPPSETSQDAFGMSVHMYLLDQGSRAYMITYTDLPDQFATGDPDPGLEGAISGSLSSAGATLESKSDISISGHPGKDVSATSPHGYMRVRYFFVGSRLYSVLAASPDRGDADSERFLNSFRLGLHKSVNTPTTVPYWMVVTATPVNTATPQPTTNPAKFTTTPTQTATPLPQPTSTPTATPANESEATVSDDSAPQGSSGALNDMEITIEGSRVDAREEDDIFGPSPGNVFLILSVRVQNVGKFSIDFNQILCTLEDTNGRQYWTTRDWHAKDPPKGPIAPGSYSSGEIAYEVPAGTQDLTFVYRPILGPRGLMLRLDIPK